MNNIKIIPHKPKWLAQAGSGFHDAQIVMAAAYLIGSIVISIRLAQARKIPITIKSELIVLTLKSARR